MGKSQVEMDLAVKSGYWPLYRYNPELKAQGENPFILESKAPDGSLQQFLAGEIRYNSLKKSFPDEFSRLTVQLEREYLERYRSFQRLAEATAVVEKPADEQPSAKIPAMVTDDDDLTCTLAGTAEHSRAGNDDSPCDDGRAGKI